MYRRFENLVNPFAPFKAETPPKKLFAFLATHWRSFKGWMPMMAVTGIIVAVMESGLIFYSGRVIDLMNASGEDIFWSRHSVELILVGLFLLFARPLLIGLNHLFLEQTLAGNMQDQVRWRAHKHMLGQSMGYFQNEVVEPDQQRPREEE
ncbi:MAG: multidrug ABC transporter ATP-binding protein, partial [Pseudomonadota bacterium]